MGIYLKMLLAYLKKNKLRTLLLIIGVMLGVMLIFGPSVIKDSQNENNVVAIHELYSGYHVEFSDLTLDDAKKLETDEKVSKGNSVQNLGRISDKKGNSFILTSSNEEYLKSRYNKIIEGRLPKNNNEIVLEKKALEAMNLSEGVGSTLNLTIKKNYKDTNGSNRLFSINKEFKIVGVMEKPKGYYDVVWQYEAVTYGNDETNNIIPNDAISYNSILSFKSGWRNIEGECDYLMKKYKLGQKSFLPNVPLVRELRYVEDDKNDPNVFKRNVLITTVSIIFIFNIFNITLNQSVKEMGLLRLMGAKKRNVRCMIIYQALIITIIGILLGLVAGVTYSYIGISNYNEVLYSEAGLNPKLYINNEIVIKAILVGIISVFISCIIPTFKIGKISPIESIINTDKIKNHRSRLGIDRLVSKIFGFYGFMGLKNIGRNKVRAAISMLSIALGGYIFITTFSSMQEEVNSKIEDMQNRYNITMQFGVNADPQISKYTDSDVENIEKIKGVKSIHKIQITNGMFTFNNKDINKEFTTYNGVEKKEIMEDKLVLKLYDDDYIDEKLNDFVEEGRLDDIKKDTDGYPNVAVYNYFYDIVDDHTIKPIFKELNIGDIITVKIPVEENNTIVYKEMKVRVAVILKDEWIAMGDGDFMPDLEIITSNIHSKNITGEQKYTQLGINLENPYDEIVNNEIQKISRSIPGSLFNSRLSYHEMSESIYKSYIKSQIAIIALVLIIASINIFCTIRTNLLIRKKEISTLRALGVSLKNMKKMLIYEALAYAVFSFIIAMIPSFINLVKFTNWNNDAYINYGIENFMSFTFPIKESLLFFAISVFVCLIAVVVSNRDFESMNIIEGIKENE
ncbi:FtsX-like permease family protein [Clostridioides difficile]|uniref:FtsX-like permease family protein n=5 Tax=Clostridioides difficile TaxID=1496 RepID=UPI00038C7E3F|nr:FtsX-like permease family protein [Clostridioides difficile]EGT3682483.1 ABC transporter permease [Clostridioides difficile]EGT3808000.1 ABC transporter permease [Clostridioides difficile]EGT3866478.1 ABC transporter permease [Clostridioides difficile]EGT4771367.1 ABC transporter permease [Clostridioides difficile]EGT4999386.1 ABC transporter permease [Clostridioides difficile]